MADPVVVVEIGTYKTIVMVADLLENGNIIIIGMGEQLSVGVRKGVIIDLEQATYTLQKAINMAEKNSDVDIKNVFLAISGGHIQSVVNRGMTPVLDHDYEISEATIEEVSEIAGAAQLPLECDKIHTIRQHFLIDGREKVTNPIGMEARSLALDSLIVYGARNHINNIIKVVKNIQLDIEDIAFSGLCSALATLTPEQKHGGVILIDMGAGTTSFVAYADNVVASIGTIGVGGDHITNDIALGMNLSSMQAEKLKVDYGSAIVEETDEKNRVPVPAEDGFRARAVSLRNLQLIINLRVEEILSIIKERLNDAKILRHIGAGVVITGGGAKLKRVKDVVENVFNLPCSIGVPRNIGGLSIPAEDPSYAVACGLFHYASKVQGNERKQRKSGFLRRILGL